MSLLFFALLDVSGPIIGISLAIGVLLLVGGLLLMLLPSGEDRPRRALRRSRNQEPPLFLPGHRITGEEAKRSRQRLEVRRLFALDAAARQPQTPASLPAPAQPAPESRLPLYAWSERMAMAETVYGLSRAEESAAAEAIPESDLTTAPVVGEALPEKSEPDQLDASQDTDPSLERVSVPLQPEQPRDVATGQEDTVTLQREQAQVNEASLTVTLAPSEAEALAAEPPASASEEAAKEPEPLAAPVESVPGEAATASAPAALERDEEEEVITAELPVPPLIRKANLSSLTQTPAAAPGYVLKGAEVSASSSPPEASPAAAVVRRAHLKGFSPSSGDNSADLPPLNPPEELLAHLGLVSPVSPETHGRLMASSPPVAEATAVGVELVSSGLRIICFGTVDILVKGQPLSPLDSRFRSSREFELVAFLAHAAAPRRQAFIDRATIIEALVPEESGESEDEEHLDESDEPPETRRSPISNWKYRLCRRLRRQGIPDHAWLETRADGALRLRSEVQIDVAEFLQVAAHLRKAHDQIRRPGATHFPRESIQEWLGQLQALYRERGAFAEQFQLREWTQEPRRRYRSVYWHSVFYAAKVLAALSDRPSAIHLAEEVFEADEVDTEEVFETLITWLSEEGNRTDLLRWLNTYRDWYAEAYRGKSLDKARPDLIELVNKQHA